MKNPERGGSVRRWARRQPATELWHAAVLWHAALLWHKGSLVKPRKRSCSPGGLAIITSLLLLSGCGDPLGTNQQPTAIEIVGGDGQSGTVGKELPDPLAVRVLHRNGQALADARVRWQVVAGGGKLRDSVTVTNREGVARNVWTLGPAIDDTHEAEAIAGELEPVLFSAEAWPGELTALRIEPDEAVLEAIEDTVRLAVVWFDGFGNRITWLPAGWEVTDETLLSVDNLGNIGRVKALGAGTAGVVATGGGLADTATVRVQQVATHLSLSPTPAYLFGLGDTLRLGVAAEDRNGHPIEIPEIQWLSLDPQTVDVTPHGTAQAVAHGTATIVARSGEAADTLRISARPGVALLEVNPGNQRLQPRQTVQLEAVVTDSAGERFTDATLEWKTSDSLTASVGADGLVTGVSDGTALVTAQIGGVQTTIQIQVVTKVDPEALESALDLYRTHVANDELRGVVLLVARRGQVVLHEALGWRDKEQGLPMEKSTLFRLASNTKPVVATAAMTLAAEGALDLNDPVANHIPAFDKDGFREIAVAQLMSHSSGLPRSPIFLSGVSSTSDLVHEAERFADNLSLQHPPGTEYLYSNVGYNVLGGVMEAVSGQRLEPLLTERIYEPLGMHDSNNFEATADQNRMSKVYVRNDDGSWRARWSPGDGPSYPIVRASGGMITTAADYARFLQMWLEGGELEGVRILPEEYIEAGSSLQSAPGGSYGYGWYVASDGRYSHSGSDGTHAWVDPDRQLIGIVFTQSVGGTNPRTTFRNIVAAGVIEDG